MTSQASHWPSQSATQQTPSVQKPEEQSSFFVHVAPFAFTQVPARVGLVVSAQNEPSPQVSTPQQTAFEPVDGVQNPLLH